MKSKFNLKILLIVLLVTLVVATVEADNGELRITFGDDFGTSNGTVVLHSSLAGASAIGEQSDGKIIVVGPSITSTQEFTIQRYNPNGRLDLSFGTNGVSHIFIAPGATVRAVAIQADDRIVIVGRVDDGFDRDLLVVRLDASGSADTSFNGTGKLIWDDPTLVNSEEEAFDVAIAPDGKIAVAGYALECDSGCFGRADAAVWRILSDGALDTSFAGIGHRKVDVGNNTIDNALGIAVQNDGKFVITGEANPISSDKYLFVARFKTSGSLDDTFSDDGLLTFDDDLYVGRDIVVQPDGKIVFGGFQLVGRLNSDGTLDTSFDGDGLIHTAGAATPLPDNVYTLALRDDDHIFVEGNRSAQRRVALLQPDGSLNTTFSDDGYFTGSGLAFYDQMILTDEGKLLILGDRSSGDGYEPVLKRYHGDGEVDNGGRMVINHSSNTTINEAAGVVAVDRVSDEIYVAGVVESSVQSAQGVDEFTLQRFSNIGDLETTFNVVPVPQFTPWDMAVDDSGRIVVVGVHGGEAGFHLRRYLDDGSLDLVISDSMGGFSADSHTLLIQSDGKYIIGGTRNFDFTVARFNENGSLDTTFGTAGMATHDFGESYESVTDLAFAGGGIVAQGNSADPFFGVNHVALTRFSADGAPDPSFTDFNLTWSNNAVPLGLSIQPNGKILSVGQIDNQWSVWRQNANGGLDSTFGTIGFKTIFTERSVGFDIFAQLDGTMVSVGCVTEDEQDITVAVRLTDSGSFDTTFSDDGIANFIFGTRSECAQAMAPINDVHTPGASDDLVVVGNAELGAGDHGWTLMRVQGPDSVPTAVGLEAMTAEGRTLSSTLWIGVVLLPVFYLITRGRNQGGNTSDKDDKESKRA